MDGLAILGKTIRADQRWEQSKQVFFCRRALQHENSSAWAVPHVMYTTQWLQLIPNLHEKSFSHFSCVTGLQYVQYKECHMLTFRSRHKNCKGYVCIGTCTEYLEGQNFCESLFALSLEWSHIRSFAFALPEDTFLRRPIWACFAST